MRFKLLKKDIQVCNLITWIFTCSRLAGKLIRKSIFALSEKTNFILSSLICLSVTDIAH